MINKIYFIKYLAVLLFSLSLAAQVSVTPIAVEYSNNGQSTSYITGCGNIDLASSTSTIINMTINIDTYQSVINNSQSDLYIYTKKSFSAVRTQSYSKNIPSTNWIPGYAANTLTYSIPVSFSINAADFDATGGTLFMVFVSPSGTEYTSSCTFTITKTPPPSFTLAPTSLGLVCGETTPRTFSVTPVNIPSGSSVTYNWNIGTGWSGTVNSSMSSITLTPTSTSSVPSSISVTPYLNGVAQPAKSCVVSLAPFTVSNSINTGSICTVGNTKSYAINGLPSGCTVNWSSTNTAVATVASGTNSQVIMQSLATGTFSIKATVINSCGQTLTSTSQPINVGLGISAPILVGSGCYANSSSPCIIANPAHTSGYVSATVQLTSPTMENTTTYSDWEWENISGRFAFTGMYVNGAIANGESIGINFLNNTIPNQIEFRCRVRNSCGWSNWKNFIMTFSDGVPPVVVTPPTTPTEYYNISPNPASTYVNITLKNPSIVPPNTGSLYVSVYTTSGSLVIPETFMNGNSGGSLYIGTLPSYTGYLLKIRYNNNVVETKYLMKN